MKVVKMAERTAATSAKGLYDDQRGFKTRHGFAYFLTKWGINRSPGMIKKAGKVIRLNIPKTTTKARTADAKD